MRVGLTGGLVLLAAAGGLLAGAQLRWRAHTRALRDRLLSAAPRAAAGYSEGELEGLPPPVARYFRHVLRNGQPVVAAAHVRWAGEFNMGSPGADRWARFVAGQDFVPAAHGMVWNARITLSLGLPVLVRDALVDGEGSMHGAVLGAFTVVHKAGSAELTEAALQRYLAEAVWLPTALLPRHGVSWTPIDASRARATLCAGAVSASVEFRFAPAGPVESAFVPDRLYDDGVHPPSRLAWQGRYLSFTAVGGMLVPAEAVVEWLLPDRTYAYWRGRPAAIDFTFADA